MMQTECWGDSDEEIICIEHFNGEETFQGKFSKDKIKKVICW